MADEIDLEAVAALRKKRQFRKFTYKGLELEKLLDLSHDELLAIVCARARRRMQRGLKRKPMALIKKLRKVKAGKSLLSIGTPLFIYFGQAIFVQKFNIASLFCFSL